MEQWVIGNKDYYHLTRSTLGTGLKRNQLIGQRTGNAERGEWYMSRFKEESPGVCPCGCWSRPGWWHRGADTGRPGLTTLQGPQLRQACGGPLSRTLEVISCSPGFSFPNGNPSFQSSKLGLQVILGHLCYLGVLSEVLLCPVTEFSFFHMELNSLV